ncbi:MAG: PEP-CTERM sorting domain-containing protein [Phycisphaerales bacterium]|nr:PEP-CTERM sorting domain-containing protein [Phycisphaerales bacterium]
MLNRKSVIVCAAAAALGFATVGTAMADIVVYDTLSGQDTFIDQQYANNYYYIGTEIAPNQTGQLTTIQIPFAVTYYNASNENRATSFDYTPNVRLDLYPSIADAVANTNLLGTANASSTFHNDGIIGPGDTVRHYNIEDRQVLTFDYTSQNVTLPSSFVFAYHDDATDNIAGTAGFSVYGKSGLTGPTYFNTYPNAVGSDSTSGPYGGTYDGYSISAAVSIVPEPATLSVLGIGAAALLMRRRRRA